MSQLLTQPSGYWIVRRHHGHIASFDYVKATGNYFRVEGNANGCPSPMDRIDIWIEGHP